MKQLLQRLDSGETYLESVPAPRVINNHILVRSKASLVSPGTERMLVEFGRASMLEKARKNPGRVRDVLDKVRTDGLLATVDAVQSKLGRPLALGYCQAGVVQECGPGAEAFEPGARVVSNGPHAEFVSVPWTLAARIPEGVEFQHACFAPVAAISLQGIRLARPTLGETFVVYGLGLVGLLTVQILRANGCKVIGIDLEEDRLELGTQFGATVLRPGDDDVPQRIRQLTGGIGVDGVLLTLSTTSDEPVHAAASACRKGGRLVLVGVTGLDIRREAFYEKELSLTVSCSYGPGRYDPTYEEQGNDYPIAYVRWTEQRNFAAVLQLMADGALDVSPLTSAVLPFAEAPQGYELLTDDRSCLGIVFEYPDAAADDRSGRAAVHVNTIAPVETSLAVPCIAVIGAGNFATRTLLPALDRSRVRLRAIVSDGGTSAGVAARRFGFEKAATDPLAVLSDDALDAVMVLTRHDSHARYVMAALERSLHVFTEKPLALSHSELDAIRAAFHRTSASLTVGFNRRFAPAASRLRALVAGRQGPLACIMTVNPGAIAREHWVHDPVRGGGRIVGEACHWIDFARFAVGSGIAEVSVTVAAGPRGRPVDDIATIDLGFDDGSIASVHYLANGSPRFPKERIDVFFDGRVVSIDNWRRLLTFEGILPSLPTFRRPEKGHREELEAWVDAMAGGGGSPIPPEEIFEVSAVAIDAAELAREGGGRRDTRRLRR